MSRRLPLLAAALALGLLSTLAVSVAPGRPGAAPAAAVTPPPSYPSWCAMLDHTTGGIRWTVVGVESVATTRLIFWHGRLPAAPHQYAGSRLAKCTNGAEYWSVQDIELRTAGTDDPVCTRSGSFQRPGTRDVYRYVGEGPGRDGGADRYRYWRIERAGSGMGPFDEVYRCGGQSG
ncbi:hypothetical protein [Phytohabitans aurantiacus]|jgi:hypothetical protein|uniref:Uncharacterized protein n=1 Tax=Phytohabitans aurantiacus TaxID=3016789 RepID=A0ABQ5QYW4_9ACTN|nr:hypothetical protein [Phytohabitans aurantiacus]GLH99232.1 hypothetical protein Pa4123_45070 [Phytohabitans aurantiacus]